MLSPAQGRTRQIMLKTIVGRAAKGGEQNRLMRIVGRHPRFTQVCQMGDGSIDTVHAQLYWPTPYLAVRKKGARARPLVQRTLMANWCCHTA